jgi:hypothetical protein
VCVTPGSPMWTFPIYMFPRSALANWRHWPWALWLVYVPALAVAQGFLPHLTQSLAYHNFADARTWLGIPRFGDVASNVGLLLAGLAGLAVLRVKRGESSSVRIVQGVFFFAVVLTAAGSAYYHWAPDSSRLLWDRLPLGLVAACFPALVLADRARLDGTSCWALAMWLAWGPLSALLWFLGDSQGEGDLWPYTLVKVIGILACLSFLVVLRSRHTLGAIYLLGIGLYLVAGLAEASDAAILAATRFVSGHSLKHLLAALGVAGLALMLAKRRNLPGTEIQ